MRDRGREGEREGRREPRGKKKCWLQREGMEERKGCEREGERETQKRKRGIWYKIILRSSYGKERIHLLPQSNMKMPL